MNVGSRHQAGTRKGRLAERADERLRQAGRAHGGIVLLFACLVVLRAASFVAFSVLLSFGAAIDPNLFRMLIIIDGALSVILDVGIVFIALMLFSTVRRIEYESDRIQTFMDSVYRRLP